MRSTNTTAKVKTWPTPQDYNEAIQNPHHNLSDPALQHGKIETSDLSKIKADNTWVGKEVTILYDPGTIESMVYKICTHKKIAQATVSRHPVFNRLLAFLAARHAAGTSRA